MYKYRSDLETSWKLHKIFHRFSETMFLLERFIFIHTELNLRLLMNIKSHNAGQECAQCHDNFTTRFDNM